MRQQTRVSTAPADHGILAEDVAARNDLVLQNLDLVQQAVNQLAARYPRHVDRDELRNAGACGLVEASRRYDPSTGVPFARYASSRVYGAIIDSTRERDWVARSVRRNARAIQSAEVRLEEREGRRPDQSELASELGITPDELSARRAVAGRASLLHLDHRFEDEETLGESLRDDDSTVLPEETLDARELLGTLRTAVSLLPDTQRQALERYYLGCEMLQGIASSMGVTEARVSQICTEAVQALRAYLGTMYEGVPEVADRAPGKRSRAAYVGLASTHATWKQRLAAADGEWVPADELVGEVCRAS